MNRRHPRVIAKLKPIRLNWFSLDSEFLEEKYYFRLYRRCGLLRALTGPPGPRLHRSNRSGRLKRSARLGDKIMGDVA
jgi:hypothetical protein